MFHQVGKIYSLERLYGVNHENDWDYNLKGNAVE